MSALSCRGCGARVTESLVDLGVQPLSNAYVRRDAAGEPETFYPLHPMVCERCFFVQLGVFEPPEKIFADYAYFSSYSTSWLAHCAAHAARCAEQLALGPSSLVVEVASNDGYLLRSFVARGIPVLGVEPAANVADVARRDGVPTRAAFFGAAEAARIAAEHGRADLMLANNVLAHVPDVHDFVAGFARLLAPGGVATFEFPHLLPLLAETQFDTIYHEHFSYLSLLAIEPVFAAHGLAVVDAERIPTHGGSLRLWVAHDGTRAASPAVAALRGLEHEMGLADLATYRAFAPRVRTIQRELVRFLIGAAERGARVAAYGAAAKGNTLLNACGVRSDLVAFVVDRNPHKQGHLLPGSRIPVEPVETLLAQRPDYVLVLPWNLRDEIVEQMAAVRGWGGRFVTAIPRLRIDPDLPAPAALLSACG
ncbi:MAG TPA: class I SAM-dependent methyltransferase [Candidatus Elarobacter sp.]|nr:class I SAM-dependent methyltransferase [Candidatus Elarobacter sp.]